MVSALRGHLAVHGIVAPQGVTNVACLAAAIKDPEAVRDLGRLLLEQIDFLSVKVGMLERGGAQAGAGER